MKVCEFVPIGCFRAPFRCASRRFPRPDTWFGLIIADDFITRDDLLAEIVEGLGFVGAGLLALLGEPTMSLDPFFGFRSGKKLAEKVHAFVRPRQLDAPMIALPDRR